MSRRIKRNYKKTLITVGVITICVSFVHFFITANQNTNTTPYQPFSLTTLSNQFNPIKIGIISEKDPIMICAEVQGEIKNIFANTGDIVKGGKPIIQIEDPLRIYENQLEREQNNVQDLQTLYEKTQQTQQEKLQHIQETINLFQQQFNQEEAKLHSLLRNELDDAAIQWTIQDSEPLESQIKNAEHRLQNLESQIENEKINQELLIKQFQHNQEEIEQLLHLSRAQYETAYLHTHKLTIRAPLEGEIKEIFVAPKQTIVEGDPLFSLQVDTSKEIILTLSFEEYLTLLHQETVTIIIKNTAKQERNILGTILSRSPIANENGMYTLRIVPTEELDTTFTEIQVFPEIQSDFFFLPKDLIEIINPQTGYLYIIEENQPKKLTIPLGQHRNGWIEVVEPLNPLTQIIQPF